MSQSSPEEGPPSPTAKSRTFGSSAPARVKLLRDQAAWCPFCSMVWMQLELKKIPYTVELVPLGSYGTKPQWFLDKVPSGIVPAIELDGEVITESAVILDRLEAAFPETPMMPPEGSKSRELVDMFKEASSELSSAAFAWMRVVENDGAERTRTMDALQAVEACLAGTLGPYAAGADVTVADIRFAPFAQRVAAILAHFKGVNVRDVDAFPALNAWFCAMEALPEYRVTSPDYYSMCNQLPLLLKVPVAPEGEHFAAVISGTDASAWRLPLNPLDSTSVPEPYGPGEEADVSRATAAANLVRNHTKVVRFAARGAADLTPSHDERESSGMRAPLSNPGARVNDAAIPAVDVALRHVAFALLTTASKAEARIQKDGDGASTATSGDVRESLSYLRDRIGVPRDMPFPAARQFRAHLNWFIDAYC